MNVIVYAIPVFFALIALELFWGFKTGRNTYRTADAINSLSCGVLSQVTGVFTRVLRIGIYGWVYQHVALWELPANALWVWILALIFYDFCYYWNHRLGHEVAVFWAAHVVHHQSQDFNLSTALRQSSSGALLGWVFYVPMAIAGVPPVVFGVVALIDLLYQYWIHTEHVGKLGWFDRVFASPSNHRVHHAVNDEYLDKNYGGILIIWDRMFGTFVEEKTKPVYGTRAPLNSWDPIWANLEVYAALIRDSLKASNWGDRIRLWLKPPGWRPADLAAREPKPAFDMTRVTLFDPPASVALQVFGGVQLALLIGAASLFLLHGPGMPLLPALLSYLALCAGLWAIGSVLQGRISVLEALFVECAAVACICQPLGWTGLFPFVKAALVFLIAAVALRSEGGVRKLLLLAGLALSLAGDMLLLSPALFVPGLVAFLLAHLAYVALFTRDAPLLPSKPTLVAVLAVAAAIFAFLAPKLPGGLLAPVAAYVLVIAVMASQAIGRALVKRDAGSALVATGSLFFMVSDTCLAINKFALPDPVLAGLVLPTYFAAQALIGFYTLERLGAARESMGPGRAVPRTSE